MPLLFPIATSVTNLLAATTTKKSSSGSTELLIFLVLIAGVYFLFVAPQRRKMRAQMNQQPQFEVGDEVVSSAGLYGTIVGFDGDRVRLEIAPGTVIEIARTAIGRRATPPVVEPEDEPEAEDHEDAHHWEPPAEDEEASTGTEANGTGPSDGSAPKPAAGGTGDWAQPWQGTPQGNEPPPGGSS